MAVAVVAIDTGGRSTTFGPDTISVVAAPPPPFGNLEYTVDAETSSTTVYQTDALMVSGWVADPTDGSPLGNVRVYVDGVPFGTPNMGLARPDVAAYFNNPAYGKSGYQLFCGASVLALGPHAVTVVAINLGGRSITFGPLTILITQGPPIGSLDAAVDSSTGSATIPKSDSLLVSGWIADPVDGAPLSNVKVYIDGSLIGTPTLGLARADVAAYFNNPSYADSGFQLVYSVAALSTGTHAVTVVAIDSGGRSTTFGPATITVTTSSASAAPPFGNLDLAVNSATSSTTISQTGTLLTQGWVADLVDGAPVSNVKVYIDGVLAGTPELGLARPDVAAYFNNAAYANSGYRIFYPAGSLAAGTHAVTVVAIDSNGRSTTFGPLTITVTGD